MNGIGAVVGSDRRVDDGARWFIVLLLMMLVVDLLDDVICGFCLG